MKTIIIPAPSKCLLITSLKLSKTVFVATAGSGTSRGGYFLRLLPVEARWLGWKVTRPSRPASAPVLRLSKTVPPEAVVYSGDCSICKLLWLSNIGNIERERSRLISGTQEANNTLRLYDIIHDKQQRMKNHFEWKRYISIDVHYKWFASYRKMHVHEVGNVNFSLDSHWIFPSCPLRPRCTTGAPYM